MLGVLVALAGSILKSGIAEKHNTEKTNSTSHTTAGLTVDPYKCGKLNAELRISCLESHIEAYTPSYIDQGSRISTPYSTFPNQSREEHPLSLW